MGGSELGTAASLLAAADVLYALGETRPHRGALDATAASRVLSGLPLDRDAIRAVLDAAGAPPPALPKLPACRPNVNSRSCGCSQSATRNRRSPPSW